MYHIENIFSYIRSILQHIIFYRHSGIVPDENGFLFEITIYKYIAFILYFLFSAHDLEWPKLLSSGMNNQIHSTNDSTQGKT